MRRIALTRRAFLGAAAAVALATWARAAPLDPHSLYHLDGLWTDQDGNAQTLASLRGSPVIAVMGYTSCPDLCPALVANMLWIDAHLPEALRRSVRFAFFSIDPARDTQARLKAFQESFGVAPPRWSFFRAEEEDVRALAHALGVRYAKNAEGGFDHSALVTLLDSEGVVLARQDGVQASSQPLLEKAIAAAAP